MKKKNQLKDPGRPPLCMLLRESTGEAGNERVALIVRSLRPGEPEGDLGMQGGGHPAHAVVRRTMVAVVADVRQEPPLGIRDPERQLRVRVARGLLLDRRDVQATRGRELVGKLLEATSGIRPEDLVLRLQDAVLAAPVHVEVKRRSLAAEGSAEECDRTRCVFVQEDLVSRAKHGRDDTSLLVWSFLPESELVHLCTSFL